MSDPSADVEVPVLKDESGQLPVPSAWRPVFREIVDALVQRDYSLNRGIPGVSPISFETAKQIEDYITDYGETLVPLPGEAWNTSVCLWLGNSWDVLVDLWTAGEGRSDMVLSARVFESAGSFDFHVYMVYVP